MGGDAGAGRWSRVTRAPQKLAERRDRKAGDVCPIRRVSGKRRCLKMIRRQNSGAERQCRTETAAGLGAVALTQTLVSDLIKLRSFISL